VYFKHDCLGNRRVPLFTVFLSTVKTGCPLFIQHPLVLRNTRKELLEHIRVPVHVAD